MIKHFLKNFCLITFALIGPITLPAGGIQRNLGQLESLNNSKEIILISRSSLYTYPRINAKQLMILKSGSYLSILRQWRGKQKDIWLRVELSKSQLIDNPGKIFRGWIKI